LPGFNRPGSVNGFGLDGAPCFVAGGEFGAGPDGVMDLGVAAPVVLLPVGVDGIFSGVGDDDVPGFAVAPVDVASVVAGIGKVVFTVLHGGCPRFAVPASVEAFETCDDLIFHFCFLL